MGGTRRRVVLGFGLWTVLLIALAMIVAGQAMASLYSGHQACFFSFPAVACPARDDPATTQLTFAFFGAPAIWLLGVIVGLVGLAIRRRRRAVD